uniref:Ephrin RBD domain-containing protein n=1 Tax=Cricetulus griseus TaxID=10029 RepID=A0A8C2LZM8_CRIGR
MSTGNSPLPGTFASSHTVLMKTIAVLGCNFKKNTPLLNCNREEQDVKFTIMFQEFSHNLWGAESQKNKDY